MRWQTPTGMKKLLSKGKYGGRKDWDGDGVSNKKDCQPMNTMRQDNMIPVNPEIRRAVLVELKKIGKTNTEWKTQKEKRAIETIINKIWNEYIVFIRRQTGYMVKKDIDGGK